MANKILRKLHLDISKNGSQGIIYARQGEVQARTLCCSLYNGATPVFVPDGADAVLYVKRHDGSQCIMTCEVKNGVVYHDMVFPEVAIAGNNECQLVVTDPLDSSITYSPSWDLFVEELIADFDNLDDLPEYSALTSALSAAAVYKTKWSNPEIRVRDAEETGGDVHLTDDGVMFEIRIGNDAHVGDKAGLLVETGEGGKLTATRKIVTGHEDPENVPGLNPGDIYIKY